MNEETIVGIDPFTGLPYLRYERIHNSGGGSSSGSTFNLGDHTTDELPVGTTNLYSQWAENTFGGTLWLQPKTKSDGLVIGQDPDASIFSTFGGISAIFNGNLTGNLGITFYGVFGYGTSFFPIGGTYISGNATGTGAAPTQLASNGSMGGHVFTAFDGTNWCTSNGNHTIPGLYGTAIGQPSGGIVDGHYYLGSVLYKMLGFRSDTNNVYLNFDNLAATTTIGSQLGTAVTVDGGTGTVTHGFTTILSGGLRTKYTSQAGDYNVLTTDYMIDCTASLTVTLPDATANVGQTYVIKNSGSGTITIATTSAQTIDGSATATISVQYVSITVVSDGANWKVI